LVFLNCPNFRCSRAPRKCQSTQASSRQLFITQIFKGHSKWVLLMPAMYAVKKADVKLQPPEKQTQQKPERDGHRRSQGSSGAHRAKAKVYERREVSKVIAMRTLFILLLYTGLISLLSNAALQHSHADAASAGSSFPSPLPVLSPWDAAVSPRHLKLPIFLLTAVDLHSFSCQRLLTHQLPLGGCPGAGLLLVFLGFGFFGG